MTSAVNAQPLGISAQYHFIFGDVGRSNRQNCDNHHADTGTFPPAHHFDVAGNLNSDAICQRLTVTQPPDSAD